MNNLPDWTDLLPTFDTIYSMAPEKLTRADSAVEQYTVTLGYGIAAIGNLLACTASNSETGLSSRTAADIGWLLESLRALSAQLTTSSTAITDRRRTVKPRA